MIHEFEEENRKDIYNRTIRQGMMKKSLDKLLVKVARPIATKLKPILQKIHPDIDFLDPVVESGLEMATLHAVAEIVQASGTIAHKLPGLNLDEIDASETTDAIARAMRGYSGERLGDKAGQMSVMLLPMARQFLSNANLAGILGKSDPQKVLSEAKTKTSDSLFDLDGNGDSQ